MQSVLLHRAPWVVRVDGPAIADGAVAVRAGSIVGVGPARELNKQYPGAPVREHEHCTLTPPLVNAHIHLELSHLHIPRCRQEVAGFTDWIAALLDLRQQLGATGAAVETAARRIMQVQHDSGVIAMGDIGNTDLGLRLSQEFPGALLPFREFLGRSPATRRTVREQLGREPDDRMFTAHAPYSTHAELIQSLKFRARRLNHPFPIHVAEPASEGDLLSRATGELYTFLRERGFLDDTYQPPAGADNFGSVRYLHSLGVLDERTICVHCIHVSVEEVMILAETGARVCLCPGSNRYLQVGTAPAALFLRHGILPALGSDSLASNPELSIWREMRILQENAPDIDPARIFAMATLGGASALGLAGMYGTLAPGKSARFLAVPLTEKIGSAPELYEYLVTGNSEIQPAWVDA
ncbi:MAG: amidohydrolase family protein [Desulfobulbaceae bacterium]|nr:amidohydrolase family protein [Desulfobulbaceae bacterium]